MIRPPCMSIVSRRWLLISLLGAVLVIGNTWPLAARLDRMGRVDSHDGQYGLWQATWVARALVTDPLHVYDANIFFPHRFTLAFSEPTLLAGMLGLPAFLITRSPYATHNLAVLGFFLLSFLGAYALGRYLTGDTLAAVAFGVSYAFSPYMFARTAQLPMMAIFGLPLALLAMHRFVDTPSPWTATGLACALWLQALACGYYTVFAILMVGVGLLYWALQGARWRSARYWLYSVVAALLTIACLLPLLWPHVRLARLQGFSRPIAEASEFAADWPAWLASSAWAHRWMLSWLGAWNEVLFPGFIPVVLGAAGAWLGLRGRLVRPTVESPSAVFAPPTPRALAGFYVLLAVLAGWCAFGPSGGLYTLLYHTVPLFGFIRAAGRFGILVTLAAGALMALALGDLRQRGGRGRTLAGIMPVLLAAELFSAPRPMSPPLAVSPVYRALAAQPRGPVIEFPLFPRQLALNSRYVLTSTSHWQHLVNGYGAFWPADLRQLASDTEDFPSQQAFQRIKDLGVRYVVVHPRLYDQYGYSRESAVVSALAGLSPQLTLVAFDDDVRLYKINP
jgi:hypothetical protein